LGIASSISPSGGSYVASNKPDTNIYKPFGSSPENQESAKAKYEFASSYTTRVLEWRLRLGKRSAGRPQARWSDNLRKTADGSWIRVAED
jgi:hypothetical protein